MKKNTALLLALSFGAVCLSFSACGGGDDPDGNIEGNACTVSVCSSDGKSLFKCDPETGAAKRVSCAKGCSVGKCNGDSPVGSECASDSDCKDASKPVCKNNICVASESSKLGCSADSDCKDASKPVCKNSVCVAAEAVSYACKGVTCAAGTCDRGVCVTDAMKKAKAGDECSTDFADFCSGNSMVYCGESGKVVVSDCSSDGGCSVVKGEEDGVTYFLAWCNGPAEKCTFQGQRILYCVPATSEMGSLGHESYYLCVQNTEGGFTAIDAGELGILNFCPSSCNADRTACADE